MNLTKLLTAFFFTILLFSCDNELNITADWKSVPVVYALVDANQDVNYFRIEKAFLDPELSGAEIAQIPDSLYYGSDVTIRLTNTDNGTTVNLQRIDLADEGFVREEGAFATNPNIGYKFNTADLDMASNAVLKLEIIDSDDQLMTEAETMVIGDYEIPTGQPADPIRFIEGQQLTFGIRSDEQAALFYDLRLYFRYEEEDINNPGVFTERVLEWVIEKENQRKMTNSGGDLISLTVFRIMGEDFYNYVGSNIEENSSIVRTFKGIDLQYDAGGSELFEYINIGQANTGITSNQIITSYTNLSNDAVGLFSSRTTTRNIESYNINTATRDSLREGRFTDKLNFN